MSTSNETKSERKMSLVQRFFVICSGADRGIIRQCPTEWNKYAGIGATIFFTGLLACLSGGYALYTVFRNTGLNTVDSTALLFAIPFGVLWGAIIFNLDRFIVSTFRKSSKSSSGKRALRELLQASPRIVLAIIIAIVISKPIEIKIFESRLAEQILRNEIEAKKSNISEYTSMYSLSAKEERVSTLDAGIAKLLLQLVTDPQHVIDMINNDLAQASSNLARIQNINNPKINACRQSIASIRNDSISYIQTTDTLQQVPRRQLTASANRKIQNINGQIATLNREIADARVKVNSVEQQIANARNSYRKQTQQEVNSQKEERDSAAVQLKSATASAERESEEANITSEKAFSNNFITQIEALGSLTANNNTMWWTSLMISLLFLTIELAPVLTKLITKRSSYDEILDRTEYENMIEQREIISRKASHLNSVAQQNEYTAQQGEYMAQLNGDAEIQKQKDKLEVELKYNKTVTETIAKYQEEIALLTIEKWRSQEIAKINSNNTETEN